MAFETTIGSNIVTHSNNGNDATVPAADDHRDNNPDAGETPEQIANRIKIRNVTKAGTGIGIIGGVALSTDNSSE